MFRNDKADLVKGSERVNDIIWGMMKTSGEMVLQSARELLELKDIIKTKKKFIWLGSSIIILGGIGYLDYFYNIYPWLYSLSPLGYFLIKGSYKTLKKKLYMYSYRGLSELFHDNVKVIDVKKVDGMKELTVYSFIPQSMIEKQKDIIENYLNTNVMCVKGNYKNKRIFYITTSKYSENLESIIYGRGSIEKRLIAVLKYYRFAPIKHNVKENDFLLVISVVCKGDIKQIMNKKTDIAMKLRVDQDRFNIRADIGEVIFELGKESEKIFLLSEHIDNVSVPVKFQLPFILGIDENTGKYIVEDINNILHTLVAGIPGFGKSVFLNSLIQSCIYFGSNVAFVLIDFKIVEFKPYEKFRNCIYVAESQDLSKVFDNLIVEMDRRFELLAKEECLKLEAYNMKVKDKLPFIVVVIDEIAEIKIGSDIATGTVTNKLIRLLNKSRAAGIRIIIATQRPSHGQLSTDIRSTLDTRIAFKVADEKEENIVGVSGSTKLTVGECIYKKCNVTRRVKTLFIPDEDSKKFVYKKLEYLKDGGLKIGKNIEIDEKENE